MEAAMLAAADLKHRAYQFRLDGDLGLWDRGILAYAAGKPILVKTKADRRRTKVCDTTVFVLKAICKMFYVKDDGQFLAHRDRFDLYLFRTTSYEELYRIGTGMNRSDGYTKNQLVRALAELEHAGIIERDSPFMKSKRHRVLKIRLRADRLVELREVVRQAKATGVEPTPLPALPIRKFKPEWRAKTAQKQTSENEVDGMMQQATCNTKQQGGLTPARASTPDDVVFPPLGDMTNHAACAASEFEVSPEMYGNKTVQEMSRMIIEAFPETKFTLKHAKAIRRYSQCFQLDRKMTLENLKDYIEYRAWSHGTWHCSCNLDIMLNGWPLILQHLKVERLLVRESADNAALDLRGNTTAELDVHLNKSVRFQMECMLDYEERTGTTFGTANASQLQAWPTLLAFVALERIDTANAWCTRHRALLIDELREAPAMAKAIRRMFPVVSEMLGLTQSFWDHIAQMAAKAYSDVSIRLYIASGAGIRQNIDPAVLKARAAQAVPKNAHVQ